VDEVDRKRLKQCWKARRQWRRVKARARGTATIRVWTNTP